MYTPNNTSVYLRACAGFMAGITAAAVTDIVEADYLGYSEMADVYAQSVDTAWDSSAPTHLELIAIGLVSAIIWSTRSPLPSDAALTSGSYDSVAQTVVARVLELNLQVISEGIDPDGDSGLGRWITVTTTVTIGDNVPLYGRNFIIISGTNNVVMPSGPKDGTEVTVKGQGEPNINVVGHGGMIENRFGQMLSFVVNAVGAGQVVTWKWSKADSSWYILARTS